MDAHRLTRRLATLSALALLALAGAAPAAAQAPEPLRMSYPQSNSQYWDLNVAIDKGFFRDEKFEPTNITGMSTPQVIQMIVANDINLGPPQPDALMVAFTRGGKDLAIMGQPMVKPDWLLIGRAGVTDIKALKGQTLGVSALRGSEYWLTERLLADQGVARGEWNSIVVGLTPSKFAALQKGSIAAAVLYQPTAQEALKQGMRNLFAFSDLPAYPAGYYVVSRKWAAENERGKRLSRALLRARAWVQDPANRAEALAILRKYTKRDQDIVEQVYDQYFVTQKLYMNKGSVDPDGLKRVIQTLTERGELAPNAITPEQILLPADLGGM